MKVVSLRRLLGMHIVVNVCRVFILTRLTSLQSVTFDGHSSQCFWRSLIDNDDVMVLCRIGGTILVARRTNNRKVVGSRPTKLVYITVLTGNRLG